ncbi:MAG: histidinol-phosphatase [Treponema sp.]|jgi:histidinol-phosphatase (PHP family)|nr:histidinol-phosphatase [Treponema sp.]
MKTNYHTHTLFCDGTESAEAMVKTAIAKDFDLLGFSGHSMYPFGSLWHIAPRDHERYVTEIRRLEKKYKADIQILLGFEADYIKGVCCPTRKNFSIFKPDYLIGSVHYIYTEKGFFTADGSPEEVTEGIQTLFDGNSRAAVCSYFNNQKEMLEKGDFTIWAHPDVIRKNNGKLQLFSETEKWYQDELLSCAKAAKKAGVIAEINTGPVSRGYFDGFYPSSNFLDILHENGVPVTISSDAHRGIDLDRAFDRALLAAKKAGYTEISQLDSSGRTENHPL